MLQLNYTHKSATFCTLKKYSTFKIHARVMLFSFTCYQDLFSDLSSIRSDTFAINFLQLVYRRKLQFIMSRQKDVRKHLKALQDVFGEKFLELFKVSS